MRFYCSIVWATDYNCSSFFSSRRRHTRFDCDWSSDVCSSDLYIDALNPFPEGTLVGLRILRDQGVFETKAKVVYCDPRFGMGLAFTEMTPDQRSLLEAWLGEIVSQLRPIS